MFTVLLNRASDRVIWQACQPKSVQYDSSGYCLYVGKGSLDGSRFSYTVRDNFLKVVLKISM